MAKKATNKEAPQFTEEQVIEILNFLGYKKVVQGDSYFFLPQRNAIKFEKKLNKDKVMELFNKNE